MIDSKEINKFAFPLVLTNIGQVIIGQIALHFAVNNSSIALSGISVIQNLLFAFGGLLGAFSLSFNIKSSKAYSNRQTNRFDDLLKSNLTLDLIIGVAFAVFVIIFGNVILKQLYGFKGHLLSLSTIYLVFMSPYIGLTLLNFSLTNLLRVQKKTKPIMWVGLISSLIDVVLNYVLVPQIGIKGAAISTIVSLAFISLDALMSRLGVELLAIYAVISQLLSIVSVPSFVYSTTVSIYLPEAEKIGEVNVFLKNIFKNSYGVSLLLACPIVLSSNVLAHFLSDEITSNIIPLTLYTFIIMGISPIYESSKMLLQVTENEKFVLQVSIWINLICVAIMILFQFLKKSFISHSSIPHLTTV